jgi:DNA-binding transcriptional regulator YhcF (GntR family)
MANFLGLAEETLSRAFSKLKKQNIMVLSNQQVSILDMAKFKQIIE